MIYTKRTIVIASVLSLHVVAWRHLIYCCTYTFLPNPSDKEPGDVAQGAKLYPEDACEL